MARRTQYLKLRRRIWYFQLDVPADLQRHFQGKRKLIKTTGERDVAQAQPVALMWAAEFKKQFADLRRLHQAGGTSLGTRPGAVYRNKLAGLQAGHFDVRFTDAAKPVMRGFAKLRKAHEKPGAKLFWAARADFNRQNAADGYKKCEEIVAKYYACSFYKLAKSWLEERGKK